MIVGEQALGEWLDARATASFFRLETLARYDVGSDGGDYDRWLRGEPEPDPDRKAVWHHVLETERARGIFTSRVHVVTGPLSDYLRFEMDWGYRYNTHLEDIHILDLAETPRPAGIPDCDFWLVDGRDVAVMHYDHQGRYLGFTPGADDGTYAAARDAALAAAVSFAGYWDSHRQYWRAARAHRAA